MTSLVIWDLSILRHFKQRHIHDLHNTGTTLIGAVVYVLSYSVSITVS